MPFASEHLEGALGAHGRSILVVDPNEMTGDIVGDLDEEIVPLCARLY
ncbi:hypothetical protein MPNT_220021 [Candidatus Methylacidithermus pantelleriae]|uniref:Uncharacterized protein n=2 Tax=Candidatus Methylacidithermus pantelleriae TaxID=2744239 RepID=A0A8J2FSA7_9BACT|nr:hypothetical protein MPNT_220021 [Candidatus Methylacidithermus pantelleriae]